MNALGPIARDRRAVGGALVIQPALGLLEPLRTPIARRDLRRQLVAAAIPEALILFGTDLARMLDDVTGQTLIVDVGRAAGVGRDLAAVDGDHVQANLIRAATEPAASRPKISQSPRSTTFAPEGWRVGQLFRSSVRDAVGAYP